MGGGPREEVPDISLFPTTDAVGEATQPGNTARQQGDERGGTGNTLEIVGIGIRAHFASGNSASGGMYPEVVEVRPGSPAEEAGILKGDVITHIDGSSAKGIARSDLVMRTTGLPGSECLLDVERRVWINPGSGTPPRVERKRVSVTRHAAKALHPNGHLSPRRRTPTARANTPMLSPIRHPSAQPHQLPVGAVQVLPHVHHVVAPAQPLLVSAPGPGMPVVAPGGFVPGGMVQMVPPQHVHHLPWPAAQSPPLLSQTMQEIANLPNANSHFVPGYDLSPNRSPSPSSPRLYVPMETAEHSPETQARGSPTQRFQGAANRLQVIGDSL